jgi:lysosomal acid lipase/cholesteryl ester hydrolase
VIDHRWDEIGAYDIPASLNYIMRVTGRDKLIYIGHSMGTAVFWVSMITHPELNKHIELMVRDCSQINYQSTHSFIL